MTDLYHTSEVTLINADGSKDDAEVVLLCEHDLSIIVNERFVMKLVCTGEYLEELVMGRLLTGGFIKSAEDVERILFCREKTEASVFLSNDVEFDAVPIEDKSCCTGNRIWYLPSAGADMKMLPRTEYRKEWIFSLARQFGKGFYL